MDMLSATSAVQAAKRKRAAKPHSSLFSLDAEFFKRIELATSVPSEVDGGQAAESTGEYDEPDAEGPENADALAGSGSSTSTSDDGDDGGEAWAVDDLYSVPAEMTGSRYLYEAEDAQTAGVRWGPKILFYDGRGQQFELWRALFLGQKVRSCSAAALLARARHFAKPRAQRWCVLMNRAGHFAGALFEGGVAVAHKTFHRYVVRAKQGGRQSEKGEGAKSAGATLRRYNEQALDQEVRDLLREWAEQLAACELIFLLAPGAANSRPIFEGGGGKAAALGRGDPRLRPLPFPTGRPGHKELQRCVGLLSEIKLQPIPAPAPEPEPAYVPLPEPMVEVISPAAAAAEFAAAEQGEDEFDSANEDEEEEEEEEEEAGPSLPVLYAAAKRGDATAVSVTPSGLGRAAGLYFVQ
jgi:hypothetical protein